MEKFAKTRPFLFWSTADYASLSEAVVLENTLNFGDFADVKELLALIGIKRAAKIFNKQLKQKRNNYQPAVANYFKFYFEKYAR